MTTEAALRDWRYGSIQAERLCAGLLQVSGYCDIDPQATLGGRDGKKDILARRDGRLVVAAVYFPPTPPTFGDIKKKFVKDRVGVAANGADSFVFFVNQHITVSQRAELKSLGSPDDEIFHIERMRHLLDSPIGYGLRLQYLRIPMSADEQAAFFSTQGQDSINEMLRNLRDAQGIWDVDRSAIAQLNIPLLALLHRVLAAQGDQHAIGGRLRAVQTFVAADLDGKGYIHPPPEEVPGRLTDLLVWWRDAYPTALAGGQDGALELLARFHHGLVSIAPFLDLNGRLARLIIDEAARELFGGGIAADLVSDRGAYLTALHTADNGDLGELVRLLRAAVEHGPRPT